MSRIKMLILAGVVALMVAFGTFAFGGGSAAADGKVTVCHVTGSDSNPIEIIDVSVNAVPAHLAHGDGILVLFPRPHCVFK